ncbi:hypothetical protein [Herbidospora sp. RD11066]
MTNAPNALCIGGPRHGMLTRVGQDIGVVHVPTGEPYRITKRRSHHPSSEIPFVVLEWAGEEPEWDEREPARPAAIPSGLPG